MKKFVIYLLTMLMAFSPAAVFADVEAAADQGDAVEVTAEPVDAVEAAVEPVDAVEEAVAVEAPAEEAAVVEAPAEEADLAPVEAETMQVEAAAEVAATAVEDDIYTWVVGADGQRDYTKAEKDGQLAKGLFKAKRYKNGTVDGTSLFYANDASVVEQKEQILTGSGYVHEKTEEGEAWKPDSGTYKYLVTLHDGFENGYFVYWQKGTKAVNGKIYFVQDNGTVQTEAGVASYDNNKYYVQSGGEIRTTAGWVTDVDGTRYYLPAETAAEGKIRVAEGLFQADGKTWYTSAGGAVRTTEGLFTYNGSKYYANNDGSVRTEVGVVSYGNNKYYVQSGGNIKTTAGWVTDVDGTRYYLLAETAAEGNLRITEGLFQADGKIWYSAAGGAVRTTGGLFTFNGSWYYSNNDGSVNTVEGFVTSGGKTWYIAPGGAVRTTEGLFTYNGSLYYSYNGGSVNTAEGFVTTADGKTYFCANGGIIKSGIIDFGGKKYVAYNDGTICNTPGFINIGAYRYYVSDASGALAVNKEFKAGSKKYHALPNGTIAVGVHQWGKYYYYADANGAIRTKKGILNWAGYRYYVKKGGKITTNKKFKYKGKTYIAGITGILNKGVFSWKGSLYYANSKSVLRTKAGAFTWNGNRYYSKKGGKLYVNKLFTAKGKKYLAQSDGTLKAGHFTWGGKMYLTDSKCAVITKAGMYTYGGHQYYVKKGGPLAVNEFVTYKDNHYYAGADGAIVKKKFTYKGVTLNPNATTGVIPLEEYWQVFPNEVPQQDTTNSGN